MATKKLNKSTTIAQWLEAEAKLASLRLKLTEVEQQATTLKPQAEQFIEEAAHRLLVDAAGQPIEGGVYWYSHQALVRVNGVVKVIPMETMDEANVFLMPVAEAADEVARRGQETANAV
ncbi:MAG: hypothetical protein KJ077_45920 [Anaerolineae bacterium]|nr:hypothetical protein [Anaerolineae bacterium]